MNPLKRLLKRITWGQKSLGSDQNRFFNKSAGDSSNFNSSKDYLNAYQLVNYVGNAVSLISGDIASLEWELVTQDGQEATDLGIEALLLEPMVGMTWNQWIARSTQHLLLDGNAFWLIDQTNALAQFKGQPNELKLLNPALVDVHDTDSEEVRANTSKISLGTGFYRVEINNSFIQIEPENICQSQLPSPHNQLRGMGKIQANAGIMDAERLTSIFNNAFFRQGAKMDYAITGDPEMGPGEFQIYKDDLRAEYEGQKNYSKLFIAPPGSKIQALSFSQKDMELVEQRKITRQDIYSFFNIPPIISGNVDLAQYDSSAEQAKSYYEVGLPRTYKILEASLNKIVRGMNPNVFFRFKTKAIIDQEKQNNIAKDMFDRGALTGNEYREKVGMPQDLDSPGLEIHWVSSNLLPAEAAAQPLEAIEEEAKRMVLAGADLGSQLPEKIKEAEQDKKPVQASFVKATSKQLALHITARNTKLKVEKRFERMTKRFYTEMEKRVLAGVKSMEADTKQPSVDEAFDFSEEISEAKRAANSVFTSAVAQSMGDINRTLGAAVDTSFSNPDVVLVVEKLNTRYADLTMNSRLDEIKAIIQRGIDEGTGVSGIKSELQTYFKTLNGPDAWRAQRIARTEASYAWDLAAQIGYRELGVTTVDVVGCEDGVHEPWDCNKTGFALSEIPILNFHPNHTGSVVPAEI